MGSVRERLATLAAPLGVRVPDEYLAFMEARPARGILVWHLCPAGDPPSAWWPAPLEVLEADVHQGRMPTRLLNAHYMRGVAEEWGGQSSVPGPGDAPFSTERLARGFWIGEVDGTCVFIDVETLGVFAYTEYCDEQRVEWWAPSFAEFAAHGQHGRAEPGAAADRGLIGGS